MFNIYIDVIIVCYIFNFFPDVPPDVTTADDHNYCTSAKAVKTAPNNTKIGHSTLSITSNHDVRLPEAAATEDVECGGTVNMLSSEYKQIGTGLIISGNILHGMELPPGFVKLAIQTIHDNTQSWPGLKDDGCMLTPGSITAWPVRFIRNIKL